MSKALSHGSQAIARLDAVVKEADRGDEKALRITRGLMDGFPRLRDAYGDLATAAEDALADLYADRSVVAREALKRTLAAMRVELASPRPSRLEKLLVNRVVACWLQSHHTNYAYARALKELPSKEVYSTNDGRIEPRASTSRPRAASRMPGAGSFHPCRSTLPRSR